MTVTVCIPVWNGEVFVQEILESVRKQTLDDITVLVSIDKSDDRSAEICRSFAAKDPRFKVFVQLERLGWIGNVNWLLRHVDSEFANILPHDDVVAPNYLERLVAELDRHPEAVLAFCDLQTFGTQKTLRVGPQATGDLFTRILDFLYGNTAAVAWRGVFRAKVLEQDCYLEEVNGAAADQVWLLQLAIQGSLIRVAETLYGKRLHDESVVAKSLAANGLPNDSHWADHCVSCHRVALSADQWTDSQRQAIAAAVLMRAMRLPNLSELGSTPSEIMTSLLAFITDYMLRLSDLTPAGSDLMTPADIPDRLRTYFARRLGNLLAKSDTGVRPAPPLTSDSDPG